MILWSLLNLTIWQHWLLFVLIGCERRRTNGRLVDLVSNDDDRASVHQGETLPADVVPDEAVVGLDGLQSFRGRRIEAHLGRPG